MGRAMRIYGTDHAVSVSSMGGSDTVIAEVGEQEVEVSIEDAARALVEEFGEVPRTDALFGNSVPRRLAEFYDHPLRGLFRVRPNSEGVLLYAECRRLGGRPAVEVPTLDPEIIDESADFPGVSPPSHTFEELVDEFGLASRQKGENTYVYLPGGGDSE